MHGFMNITLYFDLAKRNTDVSYCRKSLNYQGGVLHLLIALHVNSYRVSEIFMNLVNSGDMN